MKDEILACAERMFKSYGYDKTTFQMIADELGITKGAISYHFKFKWGIFDELFSRYLLSLHTYVGENLPKEHYNSYLHYAVIYICFFRHVMGSKSNWESFYRNEVKDYMHRERFDMFRVMFKKITTDFRKDFTEEEIRIACHMGIGAVVKLLREFDLGTEPISIDRYCYYYVYMIGLLSHLDEATIKKNITLAFEFLDKKNTPNFSLFN